MQKKEAINLSNMQQMSEGSEELMDGNFQNRRESNDPNSVLQDVPSLSMYSADVNNNSMYDKMGNQAEIREPDEEEDRRKINNKILEIQKQRQEQTIAELEIQLQESKGGVAALNKQMRIDEEREMKEATDRQAAALQKAEEKDKTLKDKNMIKKRDDSPVKPRALGPSGIRTLIRAAESRKEDN